MPMSHALAARPTPSESLGSYLTWLWRTGRKPSTKAAYEDRLRPFIAWLEGHGAQYASALHDDDVRDYAVRDYRRMLLERRLASSTISLHMAAVADFYRWTGMDRPNIPKVVLPELEAKALSEDELRAALRAAQRRGVRDAALAWGLYYTAARVGEFCNSNTDDLWISPRGGEISLLGKGDKQRTVDLAASVRPALQAWLRERQTLPYATPTGPLFYTREGKRLTVGAAEHAVKRIGEDAGIVDERGRPSLHPHVFRHTFATRYMQQPGADIRTLQVILGHADIRTTARYATPSRQRRREAMDSVDIEL